MQTTTPNRLREISEGQLPEFFVGLEQQQQPPPGSPQPPQPQPRRVEAAATAMLLTGLRTLSQRSLIALGSLFTLMTVASAWWLWLETLPQPSVYQLIGLGLYGALIVLLNWLVLRRR